jgi:hypothetical protein
MNGTKVVKNSKTGKEEFTRVELTNEVKKTKDYLDVDSIVSEAEYTYDNDVRDNPESYFDESERMLSDKQEEQIEILKDRIEKFEIAVQNFEERMDDENEEWIQEKIDELNEKI